MNPNHMFSDYLRFNSLLDQAESIRKAVELTQPFRPRGNSIDTAVGGPAASLLPEVSLGVLQGAATLALPDEVRLSGRMCLDLLMDNSCNSLIINEAYVRDLAASAHTHDDIAQTIGIIGRGLPTAPDMSGLSAISEYAAARAHEVSASYSSNVVSALSQSSCIDTLASMSSSMAELAKSAPLAATFPVPAFDASSLLIGPPLAMSTAFPTLPDPAAIYPTIYTTNTDVASVERFATEHLFDRFTSNDGHPRPTRNRERTIDETESRAEGRLDILLCALDPALGAMMSGARKARTSSNPDRCRHISISLRELFTTVLHILAPDRAFMEWVTDPSLLDDGRPTRYGRVLFVCRRIDFGLCSKFIRDDARVTCSLVEALQVGTHSRSERLSDCQLDAFIISVETQLLFLLTISKLS